MLRHVDTEVIQKYPVCFVLNGAVGLKGAVCEKMGLISGYPDMPRKTVQTSRGLNCGAMALFGTVIGNWYQLNNWGNNSERSAGAIRCAYTPSRFFSTGSFAKTRAVNYSLFIMSINLFHNL